MTMAAQGVQETTNHCRRTRCSLLPARNRSTSLHRTAYLAAATYAREIECTVEKSVTGSAAYLSSCGPQRLLGILDAEEDGAGERPEPACNRDPVRRARPTGTALLTQQPRSHIGTVA